MTRSSVRSNRWLQLWIGIACVMMVANLQYAWTYFVDPIDMRHHWGRDTIQWGFAIFIAASTWLVPIEGWFVDRLGPRTIVFVGGLLVALAWVINSNAQSLWLLYLGCALSGVGNGAVWGTCIANALKWFPDKRGLAAGLTAMGFGGGAALTVVPIIKVISAYGYESAFFWFGLAQGGILVVLSLFLIAPPDDEIRPAVSVRAAGRTPWTMLKSPMFWVIYVMFVTVAASGLIVTAQLSPIANDYKIATVSVDLFVVTANLLIAATIVDGVLNGLARPVFGWVSDYIGREHTMTIVFVLGAGAYWALGAFGHQPYLFIITAGLVYFTWGEIYGLFPAICVDFFGSRYAATNTGLLYTGKGVAAWLVPIAGLLKDYTGSWYSVFVVAMAANLVVAAAALFILKPAKGRLDEIHVLETVGA